MADGVPQYIVLFLFVLPPVIFIRFLLPPAAIAAGGIGCPLLFCYSPGYFLAALLPALFQPFSVRFPAALH